MITYYGEKVTAKRLAATIIKERLWETLRDWDDSPWVAFEKITEIERKEINRQLDEFEKRVEKLLSKSLLK
jgi:hypothetical protein